MRMSRYLPPGHPLSKVYRLGAAIFGTGLIVFGALGVAAQLPFWSQLGTEIFGLSTNGLLSTISIVVGAVLIAAAVWGGPAASTTTSVVGGLFLLSALANLAVLNTSWNLLAFTPRNVVFSLVASMLLLFLGLYGRVSGGLGEDNPYVLYRHHMAPEGEPPEQRRRERDRIDELDPSCREEIAFAEGHPTLDQDLAMRARARRQAQADRARAHARYREDHPAGTEEVASSRRWF